MTLRLAVHNFGSLTSGDEDALSHLSVQAEVKGALHLEGEGFRVGRPFWMSNLKVFHKSILAVICLYTVPVFVYAMVSRLSKIKCLQAILLTYQAFPTVYTASPGMGAVTEVAVWQEAPREVRPHELTPQRPPSGLHHLDGYVEALPLLIHHLLDPTGQFSPWAGGDEGNSVRWSIPGCRAQQLLLSPASSVPVSVPVQGSLHCV